jgi:hypothetical protein
MPKGAAARMPRVAPVDDGGGAQERAPGLNEEELRTMVASARRARYPDLAGRTVFITGGGSGTSSRTLHPTSRPRR